MSKLIDDWCKTIQRFEGDLELGTHRTLKMITDEGYRLTTEIDRISSLLARAQETKKTLADECERLTVRAERLALNVKSGWEENEELRSRLDRAQALVAVERKRVAREIAEMAYQMECDCYAKDDPCPDYDVEECLNRALAHCIISRIRKKYGVEG